MTVALDDGRMNLNLIDIRKGRARLFRKLQAFALSARLIRG